MQQAIRRYTTEIRRDHGIEVQIRVGLNSGEVVVRAIGSDLRMDYSAVGQTTHLAARMEQLATPGSTRADRRDAPARRGVRRGRRRSAPSRSRAWRVRSRCSSWPAVGDAHAAPGGGGAGAHPLRGARRRSSTTSARRSTRLGAAQGQVVAARGRARRGEIASPLGVHPLAPDPGLARARVELGLLRQGQRVPARHRPLQELLPDRGARRRAQRSGRR